MKRFRILTGLLVVMATAAFSQKQAFDASYSSHNYKHANKANIASRKKLDRVVPLQPTLVQGGSEYKHLFNQSFLVVKGVVKTKKPLQYRKGYKHPIGL